MSKINYSQEFYTGVILNSSLSESMQMKGDYILASFMNEFENLNDDEFEKPLREIKPPSFSDENDYKQDMQVIIDENYFNHQFLGLFHKDNMISLTEMIMKWMPDTI